MSQGWYIQYVYALVGVGIVKIGNIISHEGLILYFADRGQLLCTHLHKQDFSQTPSFFSHSIVVLPTLGAWPGGRVSLLSSPTTYLVLDDPGIIIFRKVTPKSRVKLSERTQASDDGRIDEGMDKHVRNRIEGICGRII